ncbi:MAG: BamA/TamA family outer membrane protein [Ignavibacteria bacterium]
MSLKYFCIFILLLSLQSDIPAQQTPEIEIGEIAFTPEGKLTFDNDVLLSQTGIKEGDLYDINIFESSVTKLQKFYFDNGFFNAEIDTTLKFDPEDNVINIKYIVREKQRYKIDSLIYTGLENIGPEVSVKISRLKTLKAKQPYNKILIIQLSNEIVDLLQNNGYINARIKADSGTIIKKYDLPSEKFATVTVGFEGADTLYYFGKTNITIEKNVYNVSEELLREEITYKEGELYDKRKKLNSERGMSKVAIVQSARIEVEASNGNKVDFDAKIKLNKKNEIVPYIKGATIENRFFIGGGSQYTDRYFWGGGRVLTIELDALYNSIKINRFELSSTFTQPNIFNNRTALSDKLTVGLYNLEDSKNYYLGNLTTLNYLLSEKTFYNNAFFDLNLELVRFKFDKDSSNLLNLFHSLLSGTFVHDNTNNVLNPSKGFYHSISVGNAGLLPKLIVPLFSNLFYSQFFKSFTSNKFYFKASSSAVLATKFEVGDIIEYGSGEKIVPVQSIYRFFSGGSSSLRGWRAKANGVLVDKNEGGKFLVEGSFELRKKLFPGADNFKKNIKAAFFLDYGNVWEDDEDFKINQIALAIGFGVRYDLFVGPIRVDFGFKLYDPLDSQGEKWLFSNFGRIFKDKFAVHFGIGEAF